jgi:hypothetical protein
MGIPSGDDKVLGESIVQNTTVSPAAMRVIRLHELPTFLGVRRSQINEAVRAGWLHPFTPIPGGRGKVVTEAEVIALQQRAMAEAAKAEAAAKATSVKAAPARPTPRKHKRKAAAEPTLTA